MTIKDIASIVGVSVTTISMVLNGKDESISKETREKVLQVVKQYNFRPYAKAIRESNARSGLIGLLVPSSTGSISKYISGAQLEAGSEGYSVVLSITNDDDAEIQKQLHILADKNMDGVALFLSGPLGDKSILSEIPEDTAQVTVGSAQSVIKHCAVYSSFAEAAQTATRSLIDAGHSQIALIGLGDSEIPLGDALLGYKNALYNCALPLQNELVCRSEDLNSVARDVERLLQYRVTAFVCFDELVAIEVYREADRFGLHIPNDCSVINLSTDNIDASLFSPKLTSIDMRYYELGRQAVSALISKIEKTGKGKPKTLAIRAQLITGASVAAPPHQKGKRISVVGSMHMDILIHTTHLPTSGESLISKNIISLPGGKGANQAVGVAKLGGDVRVVGCLGGDDEGRVIYDSLSSNGVATMGVSLSQGKASGKAYILVAQNGDSTIVFNHGTNSDLLPPVIDANKGCFIGSEFCLISTEIPWETVEYIINLCSENNIKIILKPTMQSPIAPELLEKIDFFVPNEKELNVQVPGPMSVEEKAAALYARSGKNIIVTLGERGCYLHNGETQRFFPAADFAPVDTTGAADAFISAFAVYLSEGHDVVSAIKFATYAAGLSVTRDGVQSAMADRLAVEMYADKYKED
jgi:ribokinase